MRGPRPEFGAWCTGRDCLTRPSRIQVGTGSGPRSERSGEATTTQVSARSTEARLPGGPRSHQQSTGRDRFRRPLPREKGPARDLTRLNTIVETPCAAPVMSRRQPHAGGRIWRGESSGPHTRWPPGAHAPRVEPTVFRRQSPGSAGFRRCAFLRPQLGFHSPRE
jgi:hypothetical protein